MTFSSPAPRLYASTVSIDDPGDLASFLGQATDVAWLRRGEGVVGLGVLLREEFDDAETAAAWWSDVAAGVSHTTSLPGVWGVGPLAFGSFAFDVARSARRSTLVVPRLIVGRRGDDAWVTQLSDHPITEMPALPSPCAPSGPGQVRVDDDEAGRARYRAAVGQAVARINDEASALAKVVLARGVQVTTSEPIAPGWLVARLAASYPMCWTFHVDGMVGASPEMLLRAQGGLATSRVLAGTIRRSSSQRDDVLEATLADSSKDLEEHAYAVASVEAALRPYCSGMNVPDAPFVLQLPNVMHLASDVTGVMDAHVNALQLAGRLHPSAAVCGTPTPDALASIAELEGLDRGRYAGPVGWIDLAGDGEWAIALRSGALDPRDPRRITLYAGCGIVGRSVPQAELAETDAKLRPMRDALGA